MVKQNVMKQTKGSTRRGGLDKALIPGSARPSVPAQKVMKTTVDGYALYSSNAGGTFAIADSPTLASVPGYANFSAGFDEFRIVGIDWAVIPTTVDLPGVMLAYVDDSDATAPTLTSAATRDGKTLAMSANSGKRLAFKWRSQNFTDLTWLDVSSGASTQFATCKIFASNALGGGSGPINGGIFVRWKLHVEFRGFGAH